MKYGVFISYSHADTELIEPVVRIIRTMRNDRVFQDKNDIQPGQPWEIQLTDALEEAKMVVVFWCSHSAASAYVREEYLRAIETKKKVLPVILDSSVMDKDLSAYQWIDMKDVIIHGFTRSEMQDFLAWKNSQNPPMEQLQRENYPQASLPSPPRKKRARPVVAGSLALLLTLIISTLVLIRRPVSHNVESTSYHPGPTQTVAPSDAGNTIVYIVGLLLLLTLIVYLISKYTKKRKPAYQDRSVSTSKFRFDKDVFLPGQQAGDSLAGTGKAKSRNQEDKNTIAAQMIVERIRSQMQKSFSEPDDAEL